MSKTDDILIAAWQSLAQNPKLVNDYGFPRGFWPDLARVAVEMALQDTFEPILDFRPTKSGDPITVRTTKPKKSLSEQLKEQAGAPNPASENPFERFR